MELANPQALLLLWLLPLVVLVRIYADRQREQGRRALLGAAMHETLAPMPVAARRFLGTGLVTLGLAAAIVALARPQWGVYYEDVEARGVDLFVLVDTSRSMLAEDVRPNRLERARADVRDFVGKVEGDRLGLIAFAGAAVVKCPLTLDTRFFELALQDLDTTSAPRGGTAIGDAIRVAVRAFGTETTQRARLILLLTDGDDQDSYPLEAARIAAEQGIQIIAVGLGDPAGGSLVPSAEGGYLTHDGEHVRSRLDLATLQSITEITGGAFVPAGVKHHDLGKVYDEKIAPLLGEETTGNKRSRRHERFQWFAALALACLLVNTVLSPYRSPAPGEPLELVRRRPEATP